MFAYWFNTVSTAIVSYIIILKLNQKNEHQIKRKKNKKWTKKKLIRILCCHVHIRFDFQFCFCLNSHIIIIIIIVPSSSNHRLSFGSILPFYSISFGIMQLHTVRFSFFSCQFFYVLRLSFFDYYILCMHTHLRCSSTHLDHRVVCLKTSKKKKRLLIHNINDDNVCIETCIAYYIFQQNEIQFDSILIFCFCFAFSHTRFCLTIVFDHFLCDLCIEIWYYVVAVVVIVYLKLWLDGNACGESRISRKP